VAGLALEAPVEEPQTRIDVFADPALVLPAAACPLPATTTMPRGWVACSLKTRCSSTVVFRQSLAEPAEWQFRQP